MKEIPSGLRTAFYLSTVTGIIYGSMFLTITLFGSSLMGWEMSDPGYRILGASIIGIALATYLAARSAHWEEVRIITMLQIIWPILGSLASIWGVAERSLPSIALANALFGFGFAAVFVWFYVKAETRP